jgi:excisionase family DNA binding protein
MKVEEVAAVLGVSPQAVRLWCRIGELPASRAEGTRHWRIDPSEFEAWAQRRPVVDVVHFLNAPYRSELPDEQLVAEALEADIAPESSSA